MADMAFFIDSDAFVFTRSHRPSLPQVAVLVTLVTLPDCCTLPDIGYAGDTPLPD